MDTEQPFIGARHRKVTLAHVYRHDAQRLGNVGQQQSPVSVGRAGDRVNVEPQTGKVTHVAHRDQTRMFVNVCNDVIRRKLPVPAAHQAHLDTVFFHLQPGQHGAGEFQVVGHDVVAGLEVDAAGN